MDSKQLIAPSILSADFANLEKEIKMITNAGADWVHVDVMDGHFVQNITVGVPVVKSLKSVSSIPLDVHLMITEPEKYVEAFCKAGSDYLTIHVEASKDPLHTLQMIRNFGAKPGITLRPRTDIDSLVPFLAFVDLVLIMTVEPGFGGQSFMEDQVHKIEFLKKYRKENALDFLIEVDGGINMDTASVCRLAGSDVLVAGSAVFYGAKTVENYRNNIEKLRGQ